MPIEQDRRIAEVVGREESRLRNFIRRRVPDLLSRKRYAVLQLRERWWGQPPVPPADISAHP